jgi:hypothetical protein
LYYFQKWDDFTAKGYIEVVEVMVSGVRDKKKNNREVTFIYII